jgi:hypothetical protein
MSPRFITNALLGVAGAGTVVVSQAFSAGTTGWITFGIGLGILAGLAVSQLDRSSGAVRRSLDVTTGLVAIWTVAASVIFSGVALTWLSFAEGVSFFALAIVGLIAHEYAQERLVRQLGNDETKRGDLEDRRVERYSAVA